MNHQADASPAGRRKGLGWTGRIRALSATRRVVIAGTLPAAPTHTAAGDVDGRAPRPQRHCARRNPEPTDTTASRQSVGLSTSRSSSASSPSACRWGRWFESF
jgi:hypothetical protein